MLAQRVTRQALFWSVTSELVTAHSQAFEAGTHSPLTARSLAPCVVKQLAASPREAAGPGFSPGAPMALTASRCPVWGNEAFSPRRSGGN